MDMKIGFLGAGKMATALAGGWVNSALVASGNLFACDLYPAAREAFESATGGNTSAENQEIARQANILVLAVKPAQVEEALSSLAGAWTPDHLLISIAAGVPLQKLEALLPDGARVIRVMPNTPALICASASAYAAGRHATAEDRATCGKLFSAVGIAMDVPEKLMDAVTGLSGSGPAYGYLMIEALSDGGVAAGLPRDIATRLAAQTLLGAAKMVLETGLHPGALKDMVTSPGGTTIEGVHALEQGGVRAALIQAVRVASEKSRQLGKS